MPPREPYCPTQELKEEDEEVTEPWKQDGEGLTNKQEQEYRKRMMESLRFGAERREKQASICAADP